MAKFTLKKFFQKTSAFFEDLFKPSDFSTLSDEFAKRAFKKQGYDVVQRESYQPIENANYLQAVTQSTYLLKKDNQEFVGTVDGFFPTVYTPEAAFIGRMHSIRTIMPMHTINNIKPKA